MVMENGSIVHERPWANNLILNQGKDQWGAGTGSFARLIENCAVGTGTGTPAATDVGLGAEVKRTWTYLTGAGNCGYSDVGNVRTLRRTFDFSVESGSVNYTELGWSYSTSPGNNLFSRTLISGGTVSLVSGQSLRVVYELSITVSPSTGTTEALHISGWPVSPATNTNVTWKIQGSGTFSKVDVNGFTSEGYIEPGWKQSHSDPNKSALFAPYLRGANGTLNSVLTNVTLSGSELNPNYLTGEGAAAYAAYVPGSYSRTLEGTGYIPAASFSSTSILFLGYAPKVNEYYYSGSASVLCANFAEAQTKDALYRVKFPGFTISIA